MFRDPIIWTAAGIAFLHTLLGPDHYLPFVALSRARGWSVTKTLWTTTVCGLGHVGTSLLLGLGIAAGSWSLASATGWQGLRGNTAGWLMLGFGVAYALWGLKQYWRRTMPGHSHTHAHVDGTVHGLRHTFGTRLLRKTGDLFLVKQAMLHRSILSTAAYLSVSDERLRSALQ